MVQMHIAVLDLLLEMQVCVHRTCTVQAHHNLNRFRGRLNGAQSQSSVFVHPPVLGSNPFGTRNHGHATVCTGFGCWSA
jgi:hypothetical protein